MRGTKFIVLSPLHSVIEPTGRFHNDMEKESGIAERLVSSFKFQEELSCRAKDKAAKIPADDGDHKDLCPQITQIAQIYL